MKKASLSYPFYREEIKAQKGSVHLLVVPGSVPHFKQ